MTPEQIGSMASSAFPWILAAIVIIAALALHRRILRTLFGLVMVPEDSVGLVNKTFVLQGANKTLPDGAIIALNGEAGWQADTLAPGAHFGYWPWQYKVTLQKFITVPDNAVGVVESKDGRPLRAGRVLAKHVECDAFQDARAFLTHDGERGAQITIIPPGTYRINTALFTVEMEPVVEIGDNSIGVVTTKEGVALNTGDIAGPEVAGHNAFQNGQAFVDAGGNKGLQTQVLLAGRYFLNPRFVTVEGQSLTLVPIAHVGVVISYVGTPGKDVSGETFKHGNLVSRGERGVWNEPLDPGKYPINPYTHKVENVPTANVVLNWANAKNESHKLDEKLCTITVRSSDGFTYNLDVSQIIHIPRNDAPKVIARFGSMASLVTQVLEPTIGNYFRNAAQESDAIDFLKMRTQRQEAAKTAIARALIEYNVGAVDTLIGDITPPPQLMATLTERKLAQQQQITFVEQVKAQTERQKLAQAQALADTQAEVVASERTVAIAEFHARANIAATDGAAKSAVITAEANAKSKTLNAEADANVTRLVGQAEADKTLAVGNAEASVIQRKVDAMDSQNFAGVEIARALAGSGKALVPEIMAGGGSGDGGSLVQVLIAGLVKDRMNGKGDTPSAKK